MLGTTTYDSRTSLYTVKNMNATLFLLSFFNELNSKIFHYFFVVFFFKERAYLASWQRESISDADGVRREASADWPRSPTSRFRSKPVRRGHVHYLFLHPINWSSFGSHQKKSRHVAHRRNSQKKHEVSN